MSPLSRLNETPNVQTGLHMVVRGAGARTKAELSMNREGTNNIGMLDCNHDPRPSVGLWMFFVSIPFAAKLESDFGIGTLWGRG